MIWFGFRAGISSKTCGAKCGAKPGLQVLLLLLLCAGSICATKKSWLRIWLLEPGGGVRLRGFWLRSQIRSQIRSKCGVDARLLATDLATEFLPRPLCRAAGPCTSTRLEGSSEHHSVSDVKNMLELLSVYIRHPDMLYFSESA